MRDMTRTNLSFSKNKRSFFKFGKFASMPPTLVVSLDSETVKMAHGRILQDRFVIEGVFSMELGAKSDEQISSAILLYCQTQKITRAKILGLVSPKFFISKNVDVPSTNREEVAKIINLQAGRFTPYAREEIAIDFTCLEGVVQHFTNVLLFIVNRKIVERLVAVLGNAKLRIDQVVVASHGMAATYGIVDRDVSRERGLGGIHMGEDSSELTVLDKEQVVFVRHIPVGARTFRKDPEKFRVDFAQELTRSIGAYHDQGIGRPVGKLLITGLVDDLGPVDDILNQVSPAPSGKIEVTGFDYRKYFTVSDAAMPHLRQTPAVSFFDLFSVLAHSDQNKVDLLLPELKLRRKVRDVSRDILRFGVLIMAIFFLVSLFMGSKIYFKKSLNQKLQRVSHQYGEQAKALEVISTKNRIVKKVIAKRGKELVVLNIISGFIGDDLYLSQINYDSAGTVSIAGTADSMSRVFSFVTQLKHSNYFKSVEAKETKSRKEGKQDVADFLIDCELAEGF